MSLDAKYERFPFLKELERIYSVFNQRLFAGVLALPTLVVQPDRKFVFRFFAESMSVAIGNKFATCSQSKLLEDYLHEMVHIDNRRLGILDFNANQYHNKKFLEAALAVGFCVGLHPTQGWSITKFVSKGKSVKKPSDAAAAELLNCIESLNIDKSLIREGRQELTRIVTSSSPARVSFLRYVCKCEPPHNSIRSGRRPDGLHPLKIQCLNCGSLFVIDEPSMGYRLEPQNDD